LGFHQSHDIIVSRRWVQRAKGLDALARTSCPIAVRKRAAPPPVESRGRAKARRGNARITRSGHEKFTAIFLASGRACQ
jgi:hypothetical protein